MNDEKIMQAIAVTAELTGTQLSDNAMLVMAEDLLIYPLDKVLIALERCRRELKGRLTLAAILERVDDDWQSAEEAFNTLVAGWENEHLSILTTHTAMHAAESASALFNIGDKYRAGLAFKTAYERIVSEKKAKGIQPDWYVSAGLDKEQLAQLVTEAAATGKITNDYALALLPAGEERMNIEAGNLLTDKQKEEGKARLGNLLNLITQKCALN
ncbi:hypothetical protein SALWKB2_1878 [Snodgrassella alvi wkB2]|uniref:Uncharacterized protein n=1 Tax=Snodgrassella alvi TaxID=1196083 RepID=A0ABD7Z3I5_9NEIS|nr:hypothetical protein [Snodgrassella alvi]AHN29260.1 hypothetical protein SALWKB2_1878 [Snodgrassella alvi wkB2]PIT44502.1 hypothetical protein BHC45_06385 [Snodgrassella alvi]PIT63906.1 hypothetical protein BHC52_10540 [Snodgrassella alvi]UOO97723.1 hypothetical protein LVJ87_06495 [Snodgrassella alvi wkB2]WLS98333.1 hypothetical protein RAM05_10905 [Snodgrassella alvi]